MDFNKLARDFQHRYVERPLRSWGEHEEAFVALLQAVYEAGAKRDKPREIPEQY